MRRAPLEHLIRAAAVLADDPDIVILGNQAILGTAPDAPAVPLTSIEADLFPRTHPDQLDRLRRLSLPEPGYLEEMLGEHRAVVVAVAEGDVDAAELALRRHLRMVPSLLPALRERHPDYFEEDA